MGLLDEAIREHLELKRKHGAGDDELRQQEQEALGPIRRDAAPAGDESAVAEEAEVAPEAVPAVEEALREEPVVEQVPVEEPTIEERVEPVPEVPLAPEPVQEGALADDHWLEDEQPEAEPRVPTGDTPTHGFDAVEEPAAPDEGDVLEETPEFLEETPEHDRLWFEQKPPRDFDFDE